MDTRLLRTVLFLPMTHVFSYISPLNTDTRIIRTLFHVLLVSVLTGFHCTIKALFSPRGAYLILGFTHPQSYSSTVLSPTHPQSFSSTVLHTHPQSCSSTVLHPPTRSHVLAQFFTHTRSRVPVQQYFTHPSLIRLQQFISPTHPQSCSSTVLHPPITNRTLVVYLTLPPLVMFQYSTSPTHH